MPSARVFAATVALAAAVAALAVAPASAQPERNYYIYACAESDDTVALIRFGPGGTEVVKTIDVGIWPNETEGPHGIFMSPDGRYWYLSLSHGMETPNGSINKYETGTDEWVGGTEAGMFPATLAVSPATGLLYCVNFNLYGLHEPSTVSVVETTTMTEVAQIDAGVMPHGARLNADGTRLYIVNMMNDELLEYDAIKLRRSRILPLSEAAPSSPEMQVAMAGMSAEEHAAMPHPPPIAKPTWATVPTRDGRLYVAGNGSATIFEIDVEKWAIARKFENTGKGVYNLDVTPDGRTLVATYKGDAAVGIWDLEKGAELARIATTAKVPHGVVISPDGLYAFVTVEAMYDEPGLVEVFDIAKRERVGRVEMGKQAGGLAFWTMENAGRQ